jgi:hypothetical protein
MLWDVGYDDMHYNTLVCTQVFAVQQRGVSILIGCDDFVFHYCAQHVVQAGWKRDGKVFSRAFVETAMKCASYSSFNGILHVARSSKCGYQEISLSLA